MARRARETSVGRLPESTFLSEAYIAQYAEHFPGRFYIADKAQQIGSLLVEETVVDGTLRVPLLNAAFSTLQEAEKTLPNYFPIGEFSAGVIEQMRALLDDKNQGKLMQWELRRLMKGLRDQRK